MNTTRARNVAASLAVSGFFAYLAFRNVPLAELGAAVIKVDVRWLAVSVAISLFLQVFRAWRWQLELRPLARISLARLWIVTSVSYMAINVLPVRLGEVVRPWLLSRREKVTFSNVLGTLIVEKTSDSLIIVFYILVGLLTGSNLPAWVRRGAAFPAAGAAVLVGIVLMTWFRGEGFVDRWVVRRLPKKAGTAVKRATGAILDGMSTLPDPRLLTAVLLVSLGLWFLPVLSSYVMIRAFHLAAPFNAAFVVFIFIGFGTALPNAPGMIGTYQYACILALGLFGVAKAEALAYGLLLNGVQLSTLIAQGLVALPLAGLRFSDLRRVRPEGPDQESGVDGHVTE